MNDKDKNSVNKALDASIPDLQAMWMETALSKGWDAKTASSVNVGMSGDNINLSYPNSSHDRIQSLEYGDLNTKTGPTGAIRAFSNSATKDVTSKLSKAITSTLISKIMGAL